MKTGCLAFSPIAIGVAVVLLYGNTEFWQNVKDNLIGYAILGGIALVMFLILIGFVTAISSEVSREENLRQEIKPNWIIEQVPGVGFSVMNDRGTELLVGRSGKRIAIWRTDRDGRAIGQPLLTEHIKEAAKVIDERLS